MANSPSARPPHDLHKRAEAEWQTRHRDLSATTPEDLVQLVHELEVQRTELELQNEELRAESASEDRYRGLAEQIVDGIIIADATGRPLDANRVACDLFGYTLEELKTLRPEDFLEAEEMERRLHRIAMLPLQKASLEDVLGAIVETAIAITHADFGNIQLLDPESSTLHIAAQRGFPQWWIDYWQIVSKERGTCGTAWERGERVIIEDVEKSSIFAGTDLDMQRKAGVRAVQSTPLVSRSGTLIGMFSTQYKTPCRPDEHTLLLLDLLAHEAADIIRHAQAEAELNRQAALLDLARNSIFVRDPEGRITYWNDGAAQCYGWSKEEALGKVAQTLLQTQFPEPLERILGIVQRTGHWEGELIHTCRDGRRVTMDSRWAIQPDADGKGFRILAINNDITERKRLEQERAEEAGRKDEFLAFLGHELRNPLAAIHTAIHVLSSDFAPAPPALRAKMEAIIGKQTTLMRRLVDDLLELERITHGHIELKRERLDLAECLQRAIAAMQATVASRKQDLLLRLPSDPVQFMADGTRLDQIVGNLLSNASKYTPEGGRIELSGAKEASEVVVRCKDNGQGILPEYRQQIFKAFAPGRKTEYGHGEASLGLGLALVRQLTELHGGTISVESRGAGLGSEFTVRLPLVAPPSGRQMTTKPTVALPITTSAIRRDRRGQSHRGRNVEDRLGTSGPLGPLIRGWFFCADRNLGAKAGCRPH
jgi:PAS domain S-box-containing protein